MTGDPSSRHMAAGFTSPCACVCVCVYNKVINDIYVFLYTRFQEPFRVPFTVPSVNWRYGNRTQLCSAQKRGMVTSFYICEGVKKRKSLCPFFYYLIAYTVKQIKSKMLFFTRVSISKTLYPLTATKIQNTTWRLLLPLQTDPQHRGQTVFQTP